MGDAYDLYEDGILDEMGEYIGDGIDYRERKRNKRFIPNARRGVLMYIHNTYIGKAQMPSSLKIAKKYAAEKQIKFNTEQEMFESISAGFKEFVEWMKLNASRMYRV